MLAAVGLVGCAGQPKGKPQAWPPPTIQRGPAPRYEDVAAAYNRRVEPLDRLWTRTVARLWFPGENGNEDTEQLEGVFQYIRPDRVLLTFTKIGEVYGILGSNQTQYWWIELGKNKVAHVGEHAKVTPERLRELRLPVHPLDFVDLLGITPLPVGGEPGMGAGGAGASTAEAPRVEWSQDGKTLVVTRPGRVGRERLWLDPESYELVRSAILDDAGEETIFATLGKYERVTALGPAARSAVATEIFISMDRGRTRARLLITSPEVSQLRPKPGAFDLQKILSGYGVKDVVSLDEPPPAVVTGQK